MNQDEIKEVLRLTIASEMYMSPNEVDDHELFSNYGLESITLVRVVEKVNRILGQEIELNEILGRQTLNDASHCFYQAIQSSV